MVEIVVTLAESHEGSENMVTWRVAVIKGLVTKPMGERVDTKSSLLHKENAQNASVDVAAHPIAPAKAGDGHGEEDSRDKHDGQVMLVLEADDRIFVQIRNVCAANTFGVLLHDHPAEVAVEEAFANAVGIFFGIGVSVVSPVVSSPPSDGALDTTSATKGKENFERKSCRVGGVSPKTVITGSNSKTLHIQ